MFESYKSPVRFAGGPSAPEARKSAPETSKETRRIHWANMPVQFRGIRATPETLVELSALWACGMAIAKPIAASTCDCFAVDREGNRTMMRTHPIWELMNYSPDPAASDITAFHFWQSKIFEAVVAGDSFAEIERSRMGQPTALYHLHRDRMRVRWDARGRIYYQHTNPDGSITNLASRDVFHLRGPTYDGVTSYRLWEVGRLLFDYSKAVETFGASYFANGAHIGEIFETDQTLSAEAYDRLENRLEEQYRGPAAANDYMILEGGLKFKAIATSMEVSQFIQTRQFLVEEVCRFTGVPPHKVAHLLRSTFNNIEEQNIDFKNDTLIPWAVPIQQEVQLKLIGRRMPMEVEFDLDWISEGSILDAAEAAGQFATHGIATRNELRKKRGWNKMGGNADKLTVQKQMIDLDDMSNEDAASTGDEDGQDDSGNPPNGGRARQRRQDQIRRREDDAIRRENAES